MRPNGPFCHQQCELVNVPIFPGDLLPFAVVIAGPPISEKARARPRLRRISMSDQRGFILAIRVNAVAPGVIDTDMSNFTKTEAGPRSHVGDAGIEADRQA